MVKTPGGNCGTMISVRQRGCGIADQNAEVGCVNKVLSVGGEQFIFTADGTITYFIAVIEREEGLKP
jgi:hypothetical protein